jgi:hypothetical protein
MGGRECAAGGLKPMKFRHCVAKRVIVLAKLFLKVLHLWTFKTPIILRYESLVYLRYHEMMVINNDLSFCL